MNMLLEDFEIESNEEEMKIVTGYLREKCEPSLPDEWVLLLGRLKQRIKTVNTILQGVGGGGDEGKENGKKVMPFMNAPSKCCEETKGNRSLPT